MLDAQDLPLPPDDRDEVLVKVGDQRAQIYYMVRNILDSLEEAAKWENLYYPPTENADFLHVQRALLEKIGEIPYLVWALQVQLLEDGLRRLVGSLSSASPISRQTILDMLDPEGTASDAARQAAKSSVDDLPAIVTASHRKALLWLIDRGQETAGDFSMDDFEEAIQSMPDEIVDVALKEILDNVPFYFNNIHHMTSADVEKLTAQVTRFEDPANAADLNAVNRVFVCEIAADLKGKYSSAVMGAAANLVAEGHWHGSDLEPVLFPEKAEEFERNELLVKTLVEVLESIQNVPKEVPLVEIVATWNKCQRVDRYALTHLYGFMSSVGKLMKESSRRALYSGDYHQVQQRESRLAARINELNMLHNRTWEVERDDDPSIQECYPQMADKAIQLAALLEVDLLKKLVGGDMVKALLQIVSIEGERRRAGKLKLGPDGETDLTVPETAALREKTPTRLQPVIGLLHEEDLQTFLELLLGSVQKRASFAVKQRREAAAERAAKKVAKKEAEEEAERKAAEEEAASKPAVPAITPEEVVDVLGASPDGMLEVVDFDLEVLPEPEVVEPGGVTPAAPALAAPEPAMVVELKPSPAPIVSDPDPVPEPPAPAGPSPEEIAHRLEALDKLHQTLRQFLSPQNPHRKSFDLVYRLLTQKGMIPPPMLRSIQPYLDDITEMLIPSLTKVATAGGLPISYQGELTQFCRTLARRDLTPRDMKTDVLPNMEGLLRLLSDMEAETQQMIDTFQMSSGGGGSALSSVDDFLDL